MSERWRLNDPRTASASGGGPRPLVILLHGVGADGNVLIGFAPTFARALPPPALVGGAGERSRHWGRAAGFRAAAPPLRGRREQEGRHREGRTSCRLTRRAEADLAGIGDDIAEENLRAALRVLAVLEDRCRLLGENPRLGPAREGIALGLRYLPVGRDLILYRIVDDGVEVVRVVHGARHLPSLRP